MGDPTSSTFAPEVVDAVCRHMNDDHPEDCLRIVRGLGGVHGATAAAMTGLDAEAASFSATTGAGPVAVTLPWSHRLEQRTEVRAEVVRMHAEACRVLGVDAPGHS
jgi:hypothetical protein